MDAYLQVWLENYYRKPRALTNPREIDIVSNALYKFKYVLHHYDPAYEIFAKSWGRSAADTFVALECGDYPAYVHPEPLAGNVKRWENRDLRVIWTEDAQRLAMAEPEAAREALRAEIDTKAAALNLGIITQEVYDRLRPAVEPVRRN
jgi:hypothetical protein